MDEPPHPLEYLRRNRTLFLSILLMPVIGMTAAVPLIIWKAPDNMTILLAVIAVMMIQYILLVRWIDKRIDTLLSEHSNGE